MPDVEYASIILFPPQITHATNDIGLIPLADGRRIAIAVFVTDSTADETAREQVIARIARDAYDASLQGPSPALASHN